jgi:hypothetical protein
MRGFHNRLYIVRSEFDRAGLRESMIFRPVNMCVPWESPKAREMSINREHETWHCPVKQGYVREKDPAAFRTAAVCES